jgi:hypothetical protein
MGVLVAVVAAALPETSFGDSNSSAAERVTYLEPIILSDRIVASAASLSGSPGNQTEVDFIRYAVEVRRSYGYGRRPSAALQKLRDSLKRNPGAVFDFLMRWEREAQDCTGTATASLFATFADLAPSYGALREWVDIRLTDIARSSDTKTAFRFLRCAEDPHAITQSDADLLTSIFIGIRYQLAAKGKGKPFTVPTEQVLSKISQPALRAAVARLEAITDVRGSGVR